MMSQGIPHETCVYDPNTVVFEFPLAMEGAQDISAKEHLEWWLDFKQKWCEHNPSVTVSVKPEEWDETRDWVWENFDEIVGLTFLPKDGGHYPQPPYEAITEEEYTRRRQAMPLKIDWEKFKESTDNVEGVQQLACVSGVCAI
jgi:hypothetical protein